MSERIPPTMDEPDTDLPIESNRGEHLMGWEELIEVMAKELAEALDDEMGGVGPQYGTSVEWIDIGEIDLADVAKAALSAIEGAGFALLPVSSLTGGQRIILGLQQAVEMAKAPQTRGEG